METKEKNKEWKLGTIRRKIFDLLGEYDNYFRKEGIIVPHADEYMKWLELIAKAKGLEATEDNILQLVKQPYWLRLYHLYRVQELDRETPTTDDQKMFWIVYKLRGRGYEQLPPIKIEPISPVGKTMEIAPNLSIDEEGH